MRPLLAALLFAAALATPWAQAQPPQKSLDNLRAEARTLLDAEHTNAKRELCNDGHFTQADLNQCFGREAQRINGSYLKLVRLLGSILRSDPPPDATPAAIPFDKAEAAWQDYRKKACDAVGTQFGGGSMLPMEVSNCYSTLTFNHMKELADLYPEELTNRR